jgi:phosphoenolpyruvate carboxykinase (GTP)
MLGSLESWVEEAARLTTPKRIVWCDGSDRENHQIIDEMLAQGTLVELNQHEYPSCYLHRSHPQDVARTEHLTFISTDQRDEVGPTNHWMAPAEARERLTPLFRGAMRDRTMYVVPYLMGPARSPFARVGVELTDSPYVVASLRIMTRMGQIALDHLRERDDFVPGLHSLGDLNPERRFIVHFPRERLVWSVGSGYGGNALLSKKCFALRLASAIARDEAWMAEHMLILGVEDPSGQVTYIAAAFPSACGKTNLAMLIPPAARAGYKVWTVGDDIAWLRVGPDGRLWAINPEAGFFGVVPGTSTATNPNALATFQSNSLLTNVALAPDGTPWWEGADTAPPAGLVDWQGKPWRPGNGKAAHPNARFTAPARQCPSISPRWEDPQGVPISAIVFGGRRARVAPLVFQARHWQHGVFIAASMGSETTAAQSGAVGVVRRDPMAMLPFCGYNMGDYFAHWLAMGARLRRPPALFHVNWFRLDPGGRFLWPGFGENLRVLEWILQREHGQGDAVETPIGLVPAPHAIPTDGLDLPAHAMEQLLSVDRDEWLAERAEQAKFFDQFGDRLPGALREELDDLGHRLSLCAG